MHWQEACFKSKEKRAIRVKKDGRTMIRYLDGSCIIKTFEGLKTGRPGCYREAMANESEGYNDWKPLK